MDKWTSGQVDKWTSGQVDKWTSGTSQFPVQTFGMQIENVENGTVYLPYIPMPIIPHIKMMNTARQMMSLGLLIASRTVT